MSTARRPNAIRPSASATVSSSRACGFQPCHAGGQDAHARRASGQPVSVGGEDDRGRVQLLLPVRDGLEAVADRPDSVRCRGRAKDIIPDAVGSPGTAPARLPKERRAD